MRISPHLISVFAGAFVALASPASHAADAVVELLTTDETTGEVRLELAKADGSSEELAGVEVPGTVRASPRMGT